MFLSLQDEFVKAACLGRLQQVQALREQQAETVAAAAAAAAAASTTMPLQAEKKKKNHHRQSLHCDEHSDDSSDDGVDSTTTSMATSSASPLWIDVNAPSSWGERALFAAVRQDHPDVVKYLCDCPALNVNLRDEAGKTALYAAVLNDRVEICKLLLSRRDLDVNAPGRNQPPTHWSPASLLSLSSLPQPLSSSSAASARPKSDYTQRKEDDDTLMGTVLHHASRWGKMTVVQLLLDHPLLNLETKDRKGQTAWDVARTRPIQNYIHYMQAVHLSKALKEVLKDDDDNNGSTTNNNKTAMTNHIATTKTKTVPSSVQQHSNGALLPAPHSNDTAHSILVRSVLEVMSLWLKNKRSDCLSDMFHVRRPQQSSSAKGPPNEAGVSTLRAFR